MNCPRCGILLHPDGSCPACPRAPLSTDAVGRVFRDPKRLTRWLCCLLIACILVDVLFGLTALVQAYVISAISEGSVPSRPVMVIATEASGLRRAFGNVAALVPLSAMILWLIWTYRMSANAHVLGGAGLRFTPGWAVGWYLVPLANLWVPYQAMSEIWRVSKNPARWQQERTDRRMLWWWLTSVACVTVSNIHIGGPWPGYDALILNEQLGVVSALLGLVSAMLAFQIVRQIGAFQVEAADRSLSAVFA
jgi:hypothetical protein